MRFEIKEAIDIVEKKNITLKDYKKFREIGRNIKDNEYLYFASYDEAMSLRLPEIASKEGNYDWLEPEDDD
tara:strand:+ start:1263 stop:1475 length:213 start_codon:yes stop_codon:yes gene_type:complete